MVADDFEASGYASTLVNLIRVKAFETSPDDNLAKARSPKKGIATMMKSPPPKPAGDFQKAYNEAPVKVAAEHHHGTERLKLICKV